MNPSGAQIVEGPLDHKPARFAQFQFLLVAGRQDPYASSKKRNMMMYQLCASARQKFLPHSAESAPIARYQHSFLALLSFPHRACPPKQFSVRSTSTNHQVPLLFSSAIRSLCSVHHLAPLTGTTPDCRGCPPQCPIGREAQPDAARRSQGPARATGADPTRCGGGCTAARRAKTQWGGDREMAG